MRKLGWVKKETSMIGKKRNQHGGERKPSWGKVKVKKETNKEVRVVGL